MLTARGYNLEPGDTEQSGINQLISKPFSPRQLLTAVNEVLGLAA
jgi:DNA-binding response OmpR family regulator